MPTLYFLHGIAANEVKKSCVVIFLLLAFFDVFLFDNNK